MRKNTMLPADDVDQRNGDDDAPLYDGPSKSQRKRDADALQDLGAQLVALSSERLKKIEMPDNLRDALRDAQRISAHGAHKRQLQLIGKIMRSVDPAPLKAALDEVNGVSAAANAKLHKLEQMRTRLLADDKVFAEIARDYPGADLQRLRALRRNALKEAEQGRPPRAFRELFQELKELVEAAAKVGADSTAVDDVTDEDLD
jgi:ribosome-associated protein